MFRLIKHKVNEFFNEPQAVVIDYKTARFFGITKEVVKLDTNKYLTAGIVIDKVNLKKLLKK